MENEEVVDTTLDIFNTQVSKAVTEVPKEEVTIPEEIPVKAVSEPVAAVEKKPEMDMAWLAEEKIDPLSLKDTYTKMKAELNAFKEKPPIDFATPEMAKFNQFVKETSISDWGTFSKMNTLSTKETLESNDFIEALVTKDILEDPEMIGNEDLLRARYRKQYKMDVNVEELEGEEKEEHTFSQIDLRKKGKEAVNKLKEIATKTADIPAPVDLVKESQRLDESKKAWGPVVDKIASEFKFESPVIELLENSTIKPTADILKEFTFDTNEQAVLKSYVNSILEYSKWPEVTQEAVSQAMRLAAPLFIYDRLPKLISEAVEHGKAIATQKVLEKRENPSALKPEVIAPSGGVEDKTGEMFK